ncbi:MAG: cupin domain-containing protein [Candidatus Palauibacterales bacterium]|jgi:mannose-6-phosphate isomerase-like protein (cupin superfamily)|nr:cupin domain-containing protein [Candidatus Palauibacterales bacterium]
MLDKVNLSDRMARIPDCWHPRIVGELNGQHVKLVRLQGEFVWHAHAEEDELFLVLDGTLRMELRDGAVEIEPGEFLIVPRGVEHRPVAEREVRVLLFEPAGTLNTGDAVDPRTVADPEWLP